MIEPNGPLPQSVYWRRRATAAGVSALAVVLLSWLIGGLVEAEDQHPVQGTSGTGRPGAPRTGGVSTTVSTPPSSPGHTTTTPNPATTTPVPPAAEPVPATTTTTAPPPPPGPPQPCPDDVVRVAGVPDVPSYPVGARPLLRLRITNVGAAPCTRDVSRQLREILVVGADGARLWSSNDCYGPPDEDVRVLPVNQDVEFSVNWAGRTSEPGCPVGRSQVLAGTYQVVGRLGPLVGAPTPLVLT